MRDTENDFRNNTRPSVADGGEPLTASLENQVVKLLDDLFAHGSDIVSAERVHAFFRQESLRAETLFERLAAFGKENGLALYERTFTANSFFAAPPARAFILTPSYNINVIERVNVKTRTVSTVCFQSGERKTLSAGDLFQRGESLPVLCFDGMLHSFMTSEENLAPLQHDSRGDTHSSHGNSHGGQGSAHSDEHDESASGILSKLFRLFKEERHDVGVVLAYASIVGLLALVVPLSSQAIVNAVALGVFTNQLTVMCIIVAIGIIALSGFSIMQRYVVDMLQRRLFVRTAFEVAYRMRHIKQSAIEGEYAPELVNRFFDVLTVQKTISKFLLDGVSSTLTALIGLVLLALYHPFFILLDVLLLLFVPVLIFLLGQGGLRTSIKESKKKYALVHWLEEVARCQTSFKLNGTTEFIFERVDHIATEYVKARGNHFRVLAWQFTGMATLRVFTMVGVLGIGGSLVIEKELSLGALVAAEIVVISLMSALEKLVTQFEEHYDLLTAIDKISHITEKPLDAVGGDILALPDGAASLSMHHVSFAYADGREVLKGVSLEIAAGGRVSLTGSSGAGKSTLAEILVGLRLPAHGSVEIAGQDLSRLDLNSIRKTIALVLNRDEIFDGTIEENITLGRRVSYDNLRWALKTAQLYDDILELPNGLQTRIASAGSNLSGGLVRRLMFARAVISHPKILVLDEAFGGIEESKKLKLIDSLYAEKCWTIIDISHDAELVHRSRMVFVLDSGVIVEQGTPRELALKSQNGFATLFPDLALRFQREEAATNLAQEKIHLRLPGDAEPAS